MFTSKTNPVLIWHRLAVAEDRNLRDVTDPRTSHQWSLEDFDSLVSESSRSGAQATPDQVNHAWRVISKLAAL